MARVRIPVRDPSSPFPTLLASGIRTLSVHTRIEKRKMITKNDTDTRPIVTDILVREESKKSTEESVSRT